MKIKLNSKNFLLSLTLMFAILLSILLPLGLNISAKEVYAEQMKGVYENLSVSNGEFNATSSNVYPATPSDWTKVNADAGTVNGIISINPEDVQEYGDKYELEKMPLPNGSQSNSKMLLLNAYNAKSNVGYTTSSPLTLEANSFYQISFFAHTGNNAFASATLSFDDGKMKTSLENIRNSGWTQYYFFIKTNSVKKNDVKLTLRLGNQSGAESQGFVLFDDVKAQQVSEAYYESIKASVPSENQKEENLLVTDKNGREVFQNFETNLTTEKYEETIYQGTAKSSIIAINNGFNDTDIAENPYTHNGFATSKALALQANNGGAMKYELKDTIAIPQHNNVKISFFAKTSKAISGTINAEITANNPYAEDKEYEVETKTLSIPQSTDDKNKRGWEEFSFIVKGSAFEDRTVNLAFLLGSETEKFRGYVIIDDITIEYLTDELNETISSESNVATLSLGKITETPSISNGYFNDIKITDDNIYPVYNADKKILFEAKNWEVKGEDLASNLNGIARKSTNFEQLPFAYAGSIDTLGTDSNNYFVLSNEAPSYQTLTSGEVEIPAGKYNEPTYKTISVFLKSQNITPYGANLVLYSENKIVSKIENINPSEWTKYTFNIKNNLNAQKLKITIQLGTENKEVSGAIFVDDVELNELTKENYEAIKENTTNVKLDLNGDTFEITNGKKNDNLYEPSLWTASNTSNVERGLVDTNNFNSNLYFNNPVSQEDIKQYGNFGNVLVIRSTDFVNANYTSDFKIKIDADNFYKFSILVKTQNIEYNPEDKENLGDKFDEANYGASIQIGDLEKQFIGIKNQNDDEWQKYTLIVKSTAERELTIKLGLGNANNLVKGTVFFDQFKMEASNEDEFNKNSKLESPFVLTIGNTDEKKEEDNSQKNETNFDWVLFPSIITLIALVFAILAVFSKKLSKHVQLKKKEKLAHFDRTKTLVAQHDIREQLADLSIKIQDIKKQEAEIDNLLDENELYFQKALTDAEIEDSTLENITDEEIELFVVNNDILYEKDYKDIKETNKEKLALAYLGLYNVKIQKYTELKESYDKDIELLSEQIEAINKQYSKLKEVKVKKVKKTAKKKNTNKKK